MKSKRQFILDTLLPYKNNPETCALSGDTCKYLLEDGRKCAVGKHMKEGPWQYREASLQMLLASGNTLEQILTPEAYRQGLSNAEWFAMQGYHDAIALGENLKIFVNRLERETGLLFDELR